MVRPRAARAQRVVQGTLTRASTLDAVPDADIVEKIRAGDRWAEEALFRKHFDYVAALSLRLLRDRAEADDVIQETFLAAFTQIRSVAAPESLRSWLAGIAVHKAHRRFRRRRLRALFGIQVTYEGMLEATAHTGTSPELRTELGLLDDALASLDEADRAAWILRYVEGYGLEEVGQLCGCSLSTAKRRVQRAHDLVRAHVEFEGDGA